MPMKKNSLHDELQDEHYFISRSFVYHSKVCDKQGQKICINGFRGFHSAWKNEHSFGFRFPLYIGQYSQVTPQHSGDDGVTLALFVAPFKMSSFLRRDLSLGRFIDQVMQNN